MCRKLSAPVACGCLISTASHVLRSSGARAPRWADDAESYTEAWLLVAVSSQASRAAWPEVFDLELDRYLHKFWGCRLTVQTPAGCPASHCSSHRNRQLSCLRGGVDHCAIRLHEGHLRRKHFCFNFALARRPCRKSRRHRPPWLKP